MFEPSPMAARIKTSDYRVGGVDEGLSQVFWTEPCLSGLGIFAAPAPKIGRRRQGTRLKPPEAAADHMLP